MAVDCAYLLDAKKRVRCAIVWGLYTLIEDEASYELDAEISSEYGAQVGEYIAFTGADGRMRMFCIDEIGEDSTARVTAITATNAAVAELAQMIVPEVRLTGATARAAMDAALRGSGWTTGSVTGADGVTRDIGAYRETRWKVLRDIAARYKLRITPHYRIDGGQITARTVDAEARDNTFRGRIYAGDTGAGRIDVTWGGCPVARMYATGKATGTEDPPTCVTFDSVVWSKANGDPADKPAGQSYIDDPDAAASMAVIREAVYIDRYEEDAEALLRAAWDDLQRRKQPQAHGTATAADMEDLPGREHMAVRMYDRVYVRTASGKDVASAVIGIRRNHLNPGATRITIGEEGKDEEDGLVRRVAELGSESRAHGRSGAAAGNRYIETKQLIQLNAETIQMNARLIEANAESISLTASNLQRYQEGTDKALNEVGIRLNGYEAELLLYAKQTTVDALGEQVNTVYIRLDAAEKEIELKADKIALNGYVTAAAFNTLKADVANLTSGTVQASHLYTQNLTATNTVRLSGHTCSWKSFKAVTSVGLKKDYASVPATNGITYTVISGASVSYSTGTIDYLGY